MSFGARTLTTSFWRQLFKDKPKFSGKLFRLYFWEAAKLVSPNT